jgi:hypothetical protein
MPYKQCVLFTQVLYNPNHLNFILLLYSTANMSEQHPSYAEVAASTKPSAKVIAATSDHHHAKHSTGADSEAEDNGSGSFDVAIKDSPVTQQKKPYIPKEGDLVNAGVARANIAASVESPDGTTHDKYAAKHKHSTVKIDSSLLMSCLNKTDVLQVIEQHVEYWDTDRDGIIWPLDTYRGCRKWGWSIPLCMIVVTVIHGGLSGPTVPGWLPDPFMRIFVKNLYKAKHGSDSGSIDNEGRFIPQKFEDVFAKYDKDDRKGLTLWEVVSYLNGQRLVSDYFGWLAAAFECEWKDPSTPSVLTQMKRIR